MILKCACSERPLSCPQTPLFSCLCNSWTWITEYIICSAKQHSAADLSPAPDQGVLLHTWLDCSFLLIAVLSYPRPREPGNHKGSSSTFSIDPQYHHCVTPGWLMSLLKNDSLSLDPCSPKTISSHHHSSMSFARDLLGNRQHSPIPENMHLAFILLRTKGESSYNGLKAVALLSALPTLQSSLVTQSSLTLLASCSSLNTHDLLS